VRRLTAEERTALVEIGTPGEGPVHDGTFDECIRMGWGYWERPPRWKFWERGSWRVTAEGRRALELDTLARGVVP
jgi:hypothetical protein